MKIKMYPKCIQMPENVSKMYPFYFTPLKIKNTDFNKTDFNKID